MRTNVTNIRDNEQNNKVSAHKSLFINNLLKLYFMRGSLPLKYARKAKEIWFDCK